MCIERLPTIYRIVVISSNKYFCFRPAEFYNSCCFQAIHQRHRDIHQYHIRKKFFHLLDCIVAVYRFADNRNIWQTIKKIMDNLPEILMVICDKNLNSVHTFSPKK